MKSSQAFRAVVCTMLGADPSRTVADASGQLADRLEASGVDRDELFQCRLDVAADCDEVRVFWGDLADWGNGG